MLTLLMAEERQSKRFEYFRISGEGGGGSGGARVIGAGRLAAPCLEFLLEERVVKILCELGTADRPSGTMSLVLGAMAFMLGEVSKRAGLAREARLAGGARLRRTVCAIVYYYMKSLVSLKNNSFLTSN